MSAEIEADLLLSSLRERIQGELEAIVSAAMRNINTQKLPDSKASPAKFEKWLHDLILREVESSLVPMADDLAKKVDNTLTEKVNKLEAEISRTARSDGNTLEKLRLLESKLASLQGALSSRQIHQESPQNPYVEIERSGLSGDWDGAWRLAVEVYNGVDFMVHLMGSSTPEDFFSSNPIVDPLLALQISINSCKEILESDKSVAIKLEIVSELILSLTNPQKLNLAHPFAQLKELIHHVSTKIQSTRVREIQKIIVATERLLTPPVSIVSTPMPTGARFALSSPGPRLYP